MIPKFVKDKLFEMVYTSETNYLVSLSFDMNKDDKLELKRTFIVFKVILSNLGLINEYTKWLEVNKNVV